jgi:hypothetical protein
VAGVLLDHLPRQFQLVPAVAQQHVGVRVDEPWQQAGARHLQRKPAVRRGPGDAGDYPVLDEHHRAIGPGPGPRIEYPVAGYGKT